MSYWVAYLRKSLDEEGKQVYSLDFQKNEIKKVAAEKGIKIHKFFKEERSGTDTRRPEFMKMMEGIEKGEYTGIVAYSLDRLSRNLQDSGKIFELIIRHRKGDLLIAQYKNIDWRSYEGAMLFTAHMMAAIFEVLGTQIRTLTAMQYLKAQGKQVGKLPYGYKKIWIDRKNKEYEIVIDEEKAKVIKEVYRLALDEHMGRRRIAAELGLTDSLVRAILSNEKYTGYSVVNGQVVENELPPLISLDLFCEMNPKNPLCKKMRGKFS